MSKRWFSAAATLGVASMMFGAAAMAQTVTPSPTSGGAATTTVTAGATGTAVITGTSVTTGTATVSTTAVATGTTTTGTVVPTVGISNTIYVPGGTGNFPFAHPAFQRVWERTDAPVKSGQVSRTWFWGPGPNTVGLIEAYREGPGGRHLVQYFDKSRMEINNPAGNQTDPFFVTNGLLTVDLISGSIQEGDATFREFHPACIPMSGDFGDTLAPTYFAFQKVSVNGDRVDTHQATSRVGQPVTATIDRNGNVGNDASKASMQGVQVSQFISETKHNIPQVFWNFLNEQGPVRNAQGQVVNEQLIQPWFFASGYPVSEAYWARATISGTARDVLIQAFERRALTYVPTNPPGFQVEMANIGQHYFDWRYRNFGYCAGSTVTPPGQPTVAPTGTVFPATTGTPAATGTAGATGTTTAVATGTAGATGTAVATGTAGTGATATRTASPAATGTATASATTVP
ncbi:MAG: hypothetical protein M3328_02655 [Chloroflexota bacterium]|nr:hypothetical protein [Chloroflexota bacterium]